MNKSTEVSGLSVLVFRIFLSGIFITAGITHLTQPNQIASLFGGLLFFIINNPKVYSIYNK